MTPYEMAMVMRALGQQDGPKFLENVEFKNERYYVNGTDFQNLRVAMRYWKRKTHRYSVVSINSNGDYALYNLTTGHQVCEVQKFGHMWQLPAPFESSPYRTKENIEDMGAQFENYWDYAREYENDWRTKNGNL